MCRSKIKILSIRELLELLAKIPSDVNFGQLTLNPFWDSLRGDPRFEKSSRLSHHTSLRGEKRNRLRGQLYFGHTLRACSIGFISNNLRRWRVYPRARSLIEFSQLRIHTAVTIVRRKDDRQNPDPSWLICDSKVAPAPSDCFGLAN